MRRAQSGRRVRGWQIAIGALAAAILAGGCSSQGTSGSSTPPAPAQVVTGSPLPASDLTLLHTVGGLQHLKSSDLLVTKQIAIVTGSGISWTKVISVDGASSPVLGTEQFVSYATVAQTIGDTGLTYPITLTAKGMNLVQLGMTVGHEPGEHFILLVNGSGLFGPVAKGALRLGQSDYGETVQPDSGKLTVSLIRVVPDTSASNRALQVEAAATETCNSILRATVDQSTAAEFGAKYVKAVRVEEQEVLCNSFGLAAMYATVDHLPYSTYKSTLQQGLVFPWLVGSPQAIGLDPNGYNYFR